MSRMMSQTTSKEPGVRKMFDAIAGRYDLMNRLMTFGQDQRWRRFVVERAGLGTTGRALDLASGTGDIAALINRKHPRIAVTGADFSLNMLAQAKQRFQEQPISWLGCDANRLPFADDSFTAVTFGYLLRNVDDSLRVLQEVRRVLVPGGRVVCLDTTPPADNLLKPLLKWYFRNIIPVLGRLIAGDQAAYAYLTGSTMDFHSADQLAEIFREAGFQAVGYKKFMMGTIGVHWGQK